MRAMIASGIVASAIAGRMRWRKASVKMSHWADSSPFSVYMFETKSTIVRTGPVWSSRPQRTASGTMETPGVRRPDGGRANGVSFRRLANTKTSSRPSTKIGIDTPTLATGHDHDVDG